MMIRLLLLFMLTLLLLIWTGWVVAMKLNLLVWAVAAVVCFWLQPPDDRGGSGERKENEEPSQQLRKAA
jgi:hypothetical protein